MVKILTDFVVKNAQKGQTVRVFYREANKSHHIDIQIPKLFTSRRLHPKEINRVVHRLKEDPKLSSRNVSIDVKKSGYNQNVIWLRGPRDAKKFLPRDIFPKPGTTEQMLQYVDIPLYSEIEIEDGEIKVIGEPDPRRLAKENLLCFDLETDQEGRRDNNYSRINTAAFKSDNVRDLVSILGEHSKETPNHRKLASDLSNYINTDDPVMIGNHNLHYDTLKFGEVIRTKKTEKVFPIGVDNTDPYTHAFLGFYRMPRINGRVLLDSMAFSQNWGWSKNNKLETVCEFFGIDYKKSLNYGQLEDLVEQWDNKSNYKAAKLIRDYAQQDVDSTLELLKDIQEDILDLAWLFESRVDSVSWVSKSGLAKDLRTRRRFENLHDIRSSRRSEMENFDIDKAKLGLLKKNKFKLSSKRGYFSQGDIYVAHTSFLSEALKPIIAKDKTFKYAYNLIANKERPESKIFFQEAIDAFSEEIIFDLESKRSRFSKSFPVVYGQSKDYIAARLFETITDMGVHISDNNFELINYNPKFLFLRAKKRKHNLEKILDSHPSLTLYGKADKLLSGRAGNIIALMENGVLITPGTIDMDSGTRKGHRTQFERGTLERFGELLIHEGYRQAFTYMEDKCYDLANGRIPKEELLFTLTARKESKSYVDQDSERGEAIQQFKPKKGETIYYGWSTTGRIPAELFLQSDTPVDIGRYQDKFFGSYMKSIRQFSKGTISDMAYSVLPNRTKDYKRSLQAIVEGEAKPTDLDRLVQGNKVKNTSQAGLGEYT